MDRTSVRLECLRLARDLVPSNDHAEVIRVAAALFVFIYAGADP